MEELAPGSILLKMYFKHRAKKMKARTFCEIGSGNGNFSNALLSTGMSGMGFDLNSEACENNRELNKQYITEGKYQVINSDFLTYDLKEKFDYIFSSMVIEHLDEGSVNSYFETCKKRLAPNGTITVMVPSSMKYWGIEDEIAGHYKRYEFKDLEAIAVKHGFHIKDLSGLTYPVSNWLFSLSNKVVSKQEGHKKDLSMQEQTVLSGNRGIKYKTVFPWYFKVILNPVTLFPFYVLQRLFKNNDRSMLIYCEYKLK